MHYYTYIITNKINGKQYVGDRCCECLPKKDGYLGSGSYLNNVKKKYGRKNFNKEILEICKSKKEAFNKQEKYINEYNTLVPNGYNISPTGGTWNGGKHSNETKKKISDGVKKAFLENPEMKEKISEKAKQKIGIKNCMYGKKQNKKIMKQRWINNKHPWINRNHTAESKEKISNSHKGKQLSTETKNKISKSTSGENNPMYGNIHSENSKIKMSISAKNRNKKVCEHCKKILSPGMYIRWHGDKCKNKVKK